MNIAEKAKSRIKDVVYYYDEDVIICIIRSDNNVSFVGYAVCFDMTNYDKKTGEEAAYEKALDKLIQGVIFETGK